MKLHTGFVLLLMLWHGVVIGQISEAFDNPNIQSYQNWSGDIENFIINPDSKLQLNDTDAGQSHVAVNFPEESALSKEWRLWVKHSFAGSDNNRTRFYLLASGNTFTHASVNGSAGLEGYFLTFGEGGSADAIRLWKDTGTAVILLLSGTEAAIASSFEVRIRVTHEPDGLWSLYVDYEGGEAFQFENSVVEMEFDAGIAMGPSCTYTASNADKFFFDDLYFGPIIIDADPPEITQIAVLTSNMLQVTFSEPLDPVTAVQTSNYLWQTGGFSVEAEAVGAIVTLEFATDFPSNQEQLLNVSGVADLSVNSMVPITLPFTWVVSPLPTFRDIVFSEVMADETPSVGMPEAEYLELFNASDEPFDLTGWTLVNTETPLQLNGYLLQPEAHVIICHPDDAIDFVGLPVLPLQGFLALVNDIDSLTLLSPDGELVDILAYNSTWHSADFGAGGYSLEIINPYLPCHNSENWTSSQNEQGGTPGGVNSVFTNAPDLVPPQIVIVSPQSLFEITVLFNEPIVIPGAGVDATINPGLAVLLSEQTGIYTLRITLSGPMTYGTLYTLALGEISDCSGNPAMNLVATFRLGELPVQGDIILNEIMAAPSADNGVPNAEYVEIFNKTDKWISLTGIRLNSGVVFGPSLLPPQGYAILTRPEDASLFGVIENVYGVLGFPGLTNSGLLLELKAQDGQLLESVDYNEDWYVTPGTSSGGYSLERINPNAPCSDASNWLASGHPFGGTPLAINSVFSDSPDTAPPAGKHVFAFAPDLYHLVFDSPLEAGPTTSVVLEEKQDDQFVVSEIGVSIAFLSALPERIQLYTNTELIEGRLYRALVTNASDCSGNAGHAIFYIAHAEPAVSGQLVINEILPHPWSGGADFVELHNASLSHVSLLGLSLANEEDGLPKNAEPIANEPLLMIAGSYLAITESEVAVDIQYPFYQNKELWKIYEMPAYNNDEGVVLLLDAQDIVIERVAYDNEMHFALLDDTQGISLERLSPNRPSDERTNWLSAASSVGFATPGLVNSNYSQTINSDNAFVAVPEIFSPDNDGHQDYTNLNYQLPGPGFAGNLTLHDVNGNSIRRLMSNATLAAVGTLTWDGTTDSGAKAPMGIYLCVLEYFSPDGTVGMMKAVTVVAHQLD